MKAYRDNNLGNQSENFFVGGVWNGSAAPVSHSCTLGSMQPVVSEQCRNPHVRQASMTADFSKMDQLRKIPTRWLAFRLSRSLALDWRTMLMPEYKGTTRDGY